MKVLLSWLREFAPFEGDPVALGEQLSDLGMAVESLDRIGDIHGGVVVARVLGRRPHPNADNVQLVDVDAGDGESLQIVCGAFNMREGDLVPLATVGAELPSGMAIGRRKVRGEWSNGMLCSETELHLGNDSAGILVLPADLPEGAPLIQAMGLEPDVLYDLEINPNRPDASSVAGVARDLAARLGLPFRLPEPQVDELPPELAADVSVEVLDPDLCGRFTVGVLRGVQIGPSDPAIARRLTLMGMRPINSLVDVSNYVMLELGQPNHPYDLGRVRGGGFRVRRAGEGETLVTLDGVERTFLGDDLLICDAEDAPIGIAGIMGGADTEIDDTTTDVLLEMAWFKPLAIARTSRRLKLRSEASARFERGCDPEVIELAHARFSALLAGSGARPESRIVDRRGELPSREPVSVRVERVNGVLGSQLSRQEMLDLLQPVGFTAVSESDSGFHVAIPTWRYDSSSEIDVVEEIGRLYGYTRLGQTLPSSTHVGGLTRRQRERRLLRRLMVGLGLSEAMPMPFLAPGQLEACGLAGDGIEIANPLVAEESILRTSLLPGLVGALATNAGRRNTSVKLWEIGHVVRRPAPDSEPELPDEREWLGAALGGQDAVDAVRLWRAVEEALALPGVAIVNGEVPGLHPTRSARLVGPDGQDVGTVGEVDPAVLERHDIGERVGWLEVDLDVVLTIPHGETRYRPVSRYPSSDIDLAFAVDESVAATDVETTLRNAAGDYLAWVKLFDVYRGAGIADGRRSLAYTLRLEAPDRTLTDAEVAEIRQRCIEAVESAHGATLRG